MHIFGNAVLRKIIFKDRTLGERNARMQKSVKWTVYLFSYFNKNYFDVQIKSADWVVHVTHWTEERGNEFKMLGGKPVLGKEKWVQTRGIIDKTGIVGINVTFRVTIVTVKISKNYLFWMCVCSISYTACNVHAPYYTVVCVLYCCTIYFLIISYKDDFQENVIEYKTWVLKFSTIFFWKISHFYKHWARYYHECT